MAPEQARGDGHDDDARNDVYILGMVLYPLVAGEPPFRGQGVRLLEQILTEDPAGPRVPVPTIPRDLETICLRCLEKDPRRRYASAGGLAADLRRCLTGRPVPARPVTVWGRAARLARRRPGTSALVLACAASLVGRVVVPVWNAERERRHVQEEATRQRK